MNMPFDGIDWIAELIAFGWLMLIALAGTALWTLYDWLHLKRVEWREWEDTE